MNSKLNILAESFVKLVEVVLVFRNLAEEVEGLLDKVLADDLEDLVLLQGFSRDVERKVLGVDDTLDKVEILGNNVFAIVHDKNTADVKFDVIALLLRLEEVEGSAFGNEDNSFKFELTFDREVLDRKVVLPVVRKTLVEGPIFLIGDVGRIASPDGFRFVELLVRNLLLLNLLGLLGLFRVVVVVDFLDLGLLSVVILSLLRFFLIILNFLKQKYQYQVSVEKKQARLLNLLGHGKLNGVRNEFRVLLHDLLNFFLLEILKLILLQVEADFSAATKRGIGVIGGDGECATSCRFPNVLFVVIVF